MGQTLLNKAGGRKYTLAVLGLVGISVLFLTGKITEDTFQNMIIWLVGLFTAGNVGEHSATAVSNVAASQTPPVAPIEAPPEV